MISFLLRKMWNNKWMMLSLLIGNILLIGIVASAPLYERATMQRILIKAMEQAQVATNRHPAAVELNYIFNGVQAHARVSGYFDMRDRIVPGALEAFNLETTMVTPYFTISNMNTQPVVPREPGSKIRSLNFMGIDGFENHITLLHGRLPEPYLLPGNIIECLSNELTLLEKDLIVGELLQIRGMRNAEEDYFIRIVGVFESSDERDFFWTFNPNENQVLLVPYDMILNDLINPYNPDFSIRAGWIILFDYAKMVSDDIGIYLEANDYMLSQFRASRSVYGYSINFIETLHRYASNTAKLDVTLIVLQMPIYVLLAFYIFMVSKQILSIEQNSISVLKSRGSSRFQIFGIYLIQSIMVSVFSLLTGIPLGIWICNMLGASNGFLNLVQRAALTVELTPETFIYSGIAAVLSMLTMIAPVIQFSKITIVDYKRSKSGRILKPVWQRFFVDFLLFGIACYGIYSFNNQQELLALVMTEARSVDPLLYISASLFIIGLGLIGLRFFPILLKFIFLIGKKIWKPALYTSMLKVVRSAGEEQFVMIFLIFTLALGTFNAQAARTMNANNDDRLYYSVGADIIFLERWRESGLGGGSVYQEPDYERYTGFDEVDSMTKVLNINAQVGQGRNSFNVKLMAVDTKTFGPTVWFRRDLSYLHMNYYLNVLAQKRNAVLISTNIKEQYGYELGETITFRNMNNMSASGVVSGFIDFWPNYIPVYSYMQGVQLRQTENYLIVANIGYLQSVWGVMPYEIWMNTNSSSNRFIYEYAYRYSERADEDVLAFDKFVDAKALVTDSRSDPILQGTNGVLTVGFIVTLLLCFTGFLIYWILSIRSRVLQFGIFRAMGMTMSNIVTLLINEQLFITFTAVGIGALVGEISSRLFIPLIQISYSASEQIIPLRITSELQDYRNLYSVIGIMIFICLAILGIIVSRIKIAQALKLGED